MLLGPCLQILEGSESISEKGDYCQRENERKKGNQRSGTCSVCGSQVIPIFHLMDNRRYLIMNRGCVPV